MIDGESLLPFFEDSSERVKPLVFAVQNQGAVIEQQYKLVTTKGKNELFDISKDPSEKNDISSKYPEKTKQMRIYLDNQLSEYKESFEGKEYGVNSYNRVKQKWHNITQ